MPEVTATSQTTETPAVAIKPEPVVPVPTDPMVITIGKQTATIAVADVDTLTSKGVTEVELLTYVNNYVAYLLEEAKRDARQVALKALLALDDDTLATTAKPFIEAQQAAAAAVLPEAEALAAPAPAVKTS